MGYDIYADGEFHIPAENMDSFRQAALESFAKEDEYTTVEKWLATEEPIPNPTESLASFISYTNNQLDDDSAVLTLMGDGSCDLSFGDYSVRNVDDAMPFFNTAAPWCDPAKSCISFQGEDGYQWRWEIEDGQVDEINSEVMFGQDVEAPALVRKIITVLYPESLAGKPFSSIDGADYEWAVGMIESLVREAGFGPQAGKNELERLADV